MAGGVLLLLGVEPSQEQNDDPDADYLVDCSQLPLLAECQYLQRRGSDCRNRALPRHATAGSAGVAGRDYQFVALQEYPVHVHRVPAVPGHRLWYRQASLLTLLVLSAWQASLELVHLLLSSYEAPGLVINDIVC